MASGDENESLGYAGYIWEPEYSEEKLFERLSDTDDGGDIGHARSADLTWCTCSFCASMLSLKESTCCQEFEHYATENLSDTTACITCHEDFALIFHILYILRDCIHVTLCLPVSFDDKH